MKNTDTYYHTLDNGIRIVHRRTASPVSWLGIMVGTGTRDEQEQYNGMAHYIEHTVFKGTQSRSAKQIINSIEAVGGELNAYTTKEETTFYAAVQEQYYSRAVELIADMVFHPAFLKNEVQKELGVIFDEIESYEDSPSELIYEDFEALLFQGHPLEMPILGRKKTLRRITPDLAHSFMQTNYCTSQMVFFSLSTLPMSRVIKYAEKYLCATPYNISRETPRLSAASVTPDTNNNSRQITYHRHTHQAHVMLGRRAYPIGHEKQLALYLLNNILGGGSMSSRLNMSLREQRGLVYAIESSYTPLSDTGYWCIYFASEPHNMEQCEELVRRELKRFSSASLTPYAMSRALRQLRGQMAIAAENRENTALGMAKHLLYLNDAPSWEQIYDTISHLTPDLLLETAQEIYNPDTLSVLRYQ